MSDLVHGVRDSHNGLPQILFQLDLSITITLCSSEASLECSDSHLLEAVGQAT